MNFTTGEERVLVAEINLKPTYPITRLYAWVALRSNFVQEVIGNFLCTPKQLSYKIDTYTQTHVIHTPYRLAFTHNMAFYAQKRTH